MDIVMNLNEVVTIHFSKGRNEPGTTITVTQAMPGLGNVEIKGEAQTVNYKVFKGSIDAHPEIYRVSECDEPETRCFCRQCLNDRGDEKYAMTRMICCPICGNKRCPHATDHRHECTNSNEPGQPGSICA